MSKFRNTIIALLLLLLPVCAGATEMTPSEMTPSEISPPELPLTEGYVLLDWQEADLNDDGKTDIAFIEGFSPYDISAYNEKINVRVLDGATNTTKDFTDELYGTAAELTIMNFTGRGKPEVMALVHTGSIGDGTVLMVIVDFSGEEPECLFGAERNIGVMLDSAAYSDNYRAELQFDFDGTVVGYAIDLTEHNKIYSGLNNPVYDPDGKLLIEVEPFIDSYSQIIPHQYESQLSPVRFECHQRISGIAYADPIAELISYMEYSEGDFRVVYAEVCVPVFQ